MASLPSIFLPKSMRTLLLLAWLLFWGFRMEAQNPLKMPVTLQLEGVSLEQALYELSDAAGVTITFGNDLLPQGRRVHLSVEGVDLGKVLDVLLSDTNLEARLSGGQIVLVRRPKPTPQRFTLSGFVEDAETGERIPGASVFSVGEQIGSLSNEFGFFSLTLPAGTHRIGVSYLGYQRMEVPLHLSADEHRNFELQPAFLQEIVVTTQSDSVLVESPALSVENISLDNARRLPSLGGEADVVRLTYQLAGIQTASDGLGGLSVRGGNVDQNLFLLDGVPVYNPLHGVGISSVYNASAIRSARLYKGVMPAKFGGRTSAVLDVQTKEGNSKTLQLETDIGLTSGKITVEGPLTKNKSSFFVSGRRALYDLFVVPYTSRKRREDFIDGFVSYFFYDLNLKVNHRFSNSDRLYVSYYRGADDFLDVNEQEVRTQDTVVFFADNSKVFWGNEIASLRWNHTFSPRLFANTTLTFSKYAYRSQDFLNLTRTIDTLPSEVLDALVLGYNSNNKDLAANLDFDWFPKPGHRVEFGMAAVRHRFQPGVISLDIPTDIDFDTILNRQPLKSFELDAYLQDEFQLGSLVSLNLGLRLSTMGWVEKTYVSLQPRLLLTFHPLEKFDIAFALGKASQHLHLLSPSSLGLPKDLWVSSTRRIRPQKSWQAVAGMKWRPSSNWSLEVEGYYKTLENILVFKDVFLTDVNAENWQDKVSVGEGRAFGVEWTLRRQARKTAGWLTYAVAWAQREFDQEINQGDRFPFRLDRRHQLNLVVLHRFNARWELSAAWTFATGTAFTLPLQEFEFVHPPSQNFPSGIRIIVADSDRKNNRRLPAYHRLDWGLNYYLKRGKATHAFKIGAYNTYNRFNPLYLTIKERFDENGEPLREAVEVSMLPIFPTLRYKVSF